METYKLFSNGVIHKKIQTCQKLKAILIVRLFVNYVYFKNAFLDI